MALATSIQIEQAARAFHALSDPTRVALVDLLRGGERCVCELTDALQTGQSRLSFHLRILKEAGLVLDRRDGRWVYYQLNPGRLEDLAAVLTACCAPGKPWLARGCC